VTAIEENTVICDMENQSVGKGVFVSPGKILPANTFIPSSGIIKLNPSMLELATKVHCSALQDLESCQKPIIGIIDPEVQGGLLNLINHAPTEDELANFIFAKSFSTKSVAIANLRSIIKFYQGFAIMGVEVMEDINGGEFGQQLLWSYARPDEYLDASSRKSFLLFDCRPRSNGEILDPQYYSLKEIEIFIDTGEILLRQVAVLTRWEIMETSPETHLVVAPEDPYSFNLSKPVQSPVTYKTLQIYLKSNPLAERIILKVPLLNL
jgi:hypothetical protein